MHSSGPQEFCRPALSRKPLCSKVPVGYNSTADEGLNLAAAYSGRTNQSSAFCCSPEITALFVEISREKKLLLSIEVAFGLWASHPTTPGSILGVP